MNVLNLVTTRSPFFEQQEAVLAKKGVESTTVTVPGERTAEEHRSPVDYVRFSRRVLAERPWQYDIVHANYGLTAPTALAVPGPPVVLSLWGSDLFGTYGRVSRLCARLADAVVVMSPEMDAALDVEAAVVPHGIDFDLFEPMNGRACRADLGWDPEPAHVLFPYDPARPTKNYPRAERVVEAVDDRLEGPVVLKAVTGVEHDRMPTVMNAADAMVLTSTREGSPNAVREALACNLPVVATDVGDVRQQVADATLSTVCEHEAALADALERVLTATETPDAREAIREESLDRTGDRLLTVYRSVLDVPANAAEANRDRIPVGADPGD